MAGELERIDQAYKPFGSSFKSTKLQVR